MSIRLLRSHPVIIEGQDDWVVNPPTPDPSGITDAGIYKAHSGSKIDRTGLTDNPLVVYTPGTGGKATTVFGFNLFSGSSNTGYTQTSPGEDINTEVARLQNDYGTFDDGKYFVSGFLPSTWGSASMSNAPGSHLTVCFTWTIGSISNGSHDATITSFAQSVPAGMHVRLTYKDRKSV